VVGQTSATNGVCNQGGAVGATTLCNPTGVTADSSSNLYVYDTNNNRVLAYGESNPPRSASASRVLGQHDLTHVTTNFVDATTVNPIAIAIDRNSSPNHLYAVDGTNSRVLGYTDATSFSNGAAANLVIGQPDFYSAACNTGGVSAKTLCGTVSSEYMAATVDSSGNLWVADPGNRRALEFNAPFSSGVTMNEAASIVLGEPNFTTVAGGLLCTTDSTHLCPRGLAFDSGGNLYAADYDNNRVLEFNDPLHYASTVPEPATRVFGQGSAGTALTANICNNGGEGANSLCGPRSVALDSNNNLYVADANNNRVLEYDQPLPAASPTASGFPGDVTADMVIGQGGAFNSGACNNGGTSATSLCSPQGVSVDPFNTVFIADSSNNRVLAYRESAPPQPTSAPDSSSARARSATTSATAPAIWAG
jgi:sugar lactone lactonase YvrE